MSPRIVCFATVMAAAVWARDVEVWVAPAGDDGNDGSRQAPFATLVRARDAVREQRAAAGLPAAAATITLRGGIYRVFDTLTLGPQDGGSAAHPVVWQAAPGETVRLLGGGRLTAWQPVRDPAVLARLPEVSREHVLRVDLKAAGITDLGTVAWGSQRAEVFFNHGYTTLARYPNEDWLRIAGVPEDAVHKRPVSDPKRPDLNRYEGPFHYSGDRPERWREAQDVWMHGYWYHDWRDELQRVARFDAAKQEVWPQPPYHAYGYRKGQRFYFLNILEELDQPGEWYLDRASAMLYLWPPGPVAAAEITFPELETPMLVLDQASHVTVRGVVFECSRAGPVIIRGGQHNTIAGCTVRNVGTTAIHLQGGTNHTVRGCNVYETAGTGILVQGGDRATLTPGHHVVENCHIHHFAAVFKTYHPAINLQGVGHRVSHCFIHDCPHEGIGYGGNDHTIEYCEFTRIAQETGDVGCTYTAMDWTYMGHVFRYNYFHDIHAPGKLGCFTIYPDLPCGGIHLHGNVFYNVDQVFHTNSGRGMVIENNLFLNCRRGLRFNVWRDPKKFMLGGNWRMVERLHEVDYDEPPYSTRYPVLARLAEDFARGEDHWLERALPKDNVVRRNISATDHFLTLGPQAGFQHVRVEDNVIADPIVFAGSPTGDGTSQTYRHENGDIRRILEDAGNVFAGDSAAVAALPRLGFDVPRALADRIAFEPIPFADIGLQEDVLRPHVPLRAHAPLLTPESRMFAGTLILHLTPTPIPGQPSCVVRYTLDGSDPTPASRAADGPLTIGESATVRAAAFVERNGRVLRSDVVSGTYTRLEMGENGIFLSDVQELDMVGYQSCCLKDQNHKGGPIRLAGRAFDKGILLHPGQLEDGNYGRMTFALEGDLVRASRLQAVIGIDDSMEDYGKGSSAFAVEVRRGGTWVRVFESPVIAYGDPPRQISVDISHADQIRLVTTDGGDGIGCDHAVWAGARIE